MRDAVRIREEGDVGSAVALLHDKLDRNDLMATVVYMRLLGDLQDHARLQTATRQAIRNLGPAAITEANAEYLASLLYFAERCFMPRAWIKEALDKVATAKFDSAKLETARRSVFHRQKYRDSFAARYRGWASILSLGLNCLPWHIPGRWGLRYPTDLTTLFAPCSLAGHSIEGVITALEDDFATYCVPDQVRTVATQRGHEFPLRKDRSAFWNHHRGQYWLRDDMAHLRADLATKAENFRAGARRPNAVFLLGTCPVEYPQEPLDFLPRLNAALARHTGTPHNRIIISNQTARRATPGLHRVDDTTMFFYCPYPSADYTWHDEDVANTKTGLVFERGYVGFLVRALLDLGLIEKRAGGAVNDAGSGNAA